MPSHTLTLAAFGVFPSPAKQERVERPDAPAYPPPMTPDTPLHPLTAAWRDRLALEQRRSIHTVRAYVATVA